MSDFLDRLATRAIGGEGLLMPRLPSLFEPLAGAPLGLPTREAFDTPSRDDSPLPIIETITGERGRTTAPSAVTAATSRASAHATMASAPASLNRSPAPPDAPAETVAQRSLPTDPLQPAPRMRDHAVAAPRPVFVPRRGGSHTSGDPVAPLPIQRGALLPPSSPVFASSRGNPQSSGPWRGSDAVRSRDGLADQAGAAPREPVVQVSIGRLEVRAAASACAPPRRRDEPRPDSLDDYLRQRGKASP